MNIHGLVLIFIAYFLGSIPTGLILSSYLGKIDIRKEGSGNIGATNVYRTLGKSLGALTLLGDVLKGLIPVVIAIWLLKSEIWIGLTLLCAFLGHTYSIFLKFKGGKGVATALGIFVIIVPWAVLISFLVFAGTLYKWRYVSLSSITATGSLPLWIFLLPYSRVYFIFSIIVAGLVILKHQDNIKNLINGEESRIDR